MKKISVIILWSVAASLCVLLSSCSSIFYAPNMQNVPLLQKKNETRINIAGSAGLQFGAFEMQGSHSFSDHIGGMFNFASGGSNDGYGFITHGTFAEAGVGYYHPMGKYFVAEGYGGLGFGGMKNEYGSSNIYSKASYMKPFIQPDIGVRFSFFEFAFSTRLGMLNYLNLEHGLLPDNEKDGIEIVNENRTTFVFEPALTLRLGWKYVLFQLQVGESFNSIPLFPQEMINENIGLIFTIPPPKISPKIK